MEQLRESVQQPKLIGSVCVHQIPNQSKEFGQALRMGYTRNIGEITIIISDQNNNPLEN
jgi:hypothetical protein